MEKFFDANFLLLEDTNTKMEQVKVLQGRIHEPSDRKNYASDTFKRNENNFNRKSYPNEGTDSH